MKFKVSSEFGLLLNLSNIYKQPIVRSVIRQLIGLKDSSMLLSGDDSGLANVWDEICIQVQYEHSFYWSAYEETINNLIANELNKQPPAVKVLFSYLGRGEWATSDNEEECFEYDEASACKEIFEEVISEAGSYQNKRITRFLDNNYID
jgi:hypothetical protein